jgi:endo-1,4-beta-xylanase
MILRVFPFVAVSVLATAAPPGPGVGTEDRGTTSESLKRAAAGRFGIGVGVDHGVIERPEEVALLTRHFDVVTPENCMKMTSVQAKEGVFDFVKADEFVAFAEEHGLKVVGHNLLWAQPGTTPDWFFKDGEGEASAEKVLARLRSHIHQLAGRYRGRIAMWDVVNEALADPADEYLRDCEWSRLFGEQYVVKAFQYAREAAPDAVLIYNDYRCDQPGKLKKLIRLVTSVREQGGPIDAIGLQAHYEYGMIPFDGIEAALVAMREQKMKVVFSELDMDVVTRSRWWADGGKHREELASYDPYPGECPPDVLQSQAVQYAKLFELIARHPDVVERVTFWNLQDGRSWLNDFPWKRTNHPLLFDRNLSPKTAYQAVIGALREAPSR